MEKLPGGTDTDSRKIADYFEKKLGVPKLEPKGIKKVTFNAAFWYKIAKDCEFRCKPSEEAKDGWDRVSEYYISKQKYIFTNKEPVAAEITEPADEPDEPQDLAD